MPGPKNKAPQAGWLQQHSLFSHDPGAWKSEVKALVGLVSPISISPWLVDDGLSPPCVLAWSSEGVCALISSFYKVTSPIELGSIRMTLFYLNYLQMQSYSESWGLGLDHLSFVKDAIQPRTQPN